MACPGNGAGIDRLFGRPLSHQFGRTIRSDRIMLISGIRRHFVDERRVVIAVAGLVDAPRHWPHAKAVLGGRYEKLCTGGAVEPWPDIRLL